MSEEKNSRMLQITHIIIIIILNKSKNSVGMLMLIRKNVSKNALPHNEQPILNIYDLNIKRFPHNKETQRLPKNISVT